MTIEDLKAFIAVATERSFSRAARTLRRTQPAVSQAIRRLEEACGERLIDRSLRDGTLTDAGELLLDYARRTVGLLDEATRAVSDLRGLKTGRVVIGANEAGVHTLLPLIALFQKQHPQVQIDVRRVPARMMAQEVLLRSVEFGVLTFSPPDRELQSMALGTDETVLLVAPAHPLARKRQVTMEEVGRQVIIAHNDPSPTRERVLRLYERRHAPLLQQPGHAAGKAQEAAHGDEVLLQRVGRHGPRARLELGRVQAGLVVAPLHRHGPCQ